MGQQLKPRIKRARRKRWLKRKNEAVKAAVKTASAKKKTA